MSPYTDAIFWPLCMGLQVSNSIACTLLAPLKLSRPARDGNHQALVEVVASTALAQPPATSLVKLARTSSSACFV